VEIIFDTLVQAVGADKIVTYLVYGSSGATFLFGSWMPLIGILLVFCALDLITGLAKGIYDKDLRSRKMSKGMISKAMYFVIVIIANMLDIALMGGLPVAKTGVLLFYIALEGLSILENLGQMNVPIPAFIRTHLMVLRDKATTIEINHELQKDDKK